MHPLGFTVFNSRIHLPVFVHSFLFLLPSTPNRVKHVFKPVFEHFTTIDQFLQMSNLIALGACIMAQRIHRPTTLSHAFLNPACFNWFEPDESPLLDSTHLVYDYRSWRVQPPSGHPVRGRVYQ